MEAFQELVDKKFEEFKSTFLHEIKTEFGKFFNEERDKLSSFVETKKASIADEIKNEFQESLKAVQRQVTELKSENVKLKKDLDGLQQYVRRRNVRIFGVPLKENESRDLCEEVHKIIADADIDIQTSSVDRAHRIGKVKEVNGQPTQPVIVRFTSFRDRTKFYKARKTIREKLGYGVVFDLTYDRLSLLKEARSLVENVEDIKFVYTDINCNLRAFTNSKKHIKFDSIESLHDVIKNL